jgi:hypothetical protein
MPVFSKRELEGYICIDHTDSPGMPTGPFKGGVKFEGATITCSHCQRIVIINPDRTRSRAWCSVCDHYICDECSLERAGTGYSHKSFRQKVDEIVKSSS